MGSMNSKEQPPRPRPQHPPKPPPFPVPATVTTPAAHGHDDELARRMQALHVSPPSNPPPGWAGGFNLPLSVLAQHDPYASANARPSGPPMPQPTPYGASYPQIQSPISGPLMPMPMPTPYTPSSSAPALTRPSYASNRRSSNPTPKPSPPTPPRKTPSPPGTPGTKTRPSRRRTASESTEEQCSGTTLAGKRCTRPGKTPPGAAYHDSQLDGPIERFCHQHMPAILKPTGFRSGKAGSPLVLFEDWVPTYLQDDTKAALRVEMEKPVSGADVPGYIYCFEILNDDTPGFVHFKVGRTTSLKKRINQWDRQCGSKEQILRGCWPSTGDTSKLKAKLQDGEKGPNCHRLEKLVHLELGDVSENTPYLLAGWPKPNLTSLTSNASGSGSGSGASTPPATPTKKKKSKFSDVKMSGKECPDCGKVHKEIFTFAKATGKNKGNEYKDVVWPIISKWGNFVETCL